MRKMDFVQVEPEIVRQLHYKAAKGRIPLSGTFELSPLCNMNCKMCYVTLSAKEQKRRCALRKKEEWLALAAEAKKEGMLFLLLTGGEPFFWPDFRELYQELYEMGLCISMNSNGTLIDEKVMEWLKETPPTRINITLYGASNKTYEEMCGKKDGFSKVTRAIDLLLEAGICVKLNCSLTPYNQGDLEEMIRFAEERQLILEVATYMFPPIRKNEALTGKNQRFTPEETAKKMIKTYLLQRGEETFRHYLGCNQFPPLEKQECLEEEGDGVLCRAGKSSFWVTWDFQLLACGLMTMPKEKLQLGSFKEAWKHLYTAVDQIRLAPECKQCNLKEQCQTCAAMILAETGTFDRKPEYRCEAITSYVELCEQLKENFDQWKRIV